MITSTIKGLVWEVEGYIYSYYEWGPQQQYLIRIHEKIHTESPIGTIN